MKKAIKKIKKYAEGGELETLDSETSLLTGDPVVPSKTPKGPVTEEQWNSLKTKYTQGLPQVKPYGASEKGSALDKRMKWTTWANQKLPTSGTPAELSAKAAKQAGIDPGMLLASSLEEGVGLRFMGQGSDYSNAYIEANKKGELKDYPVDAFRNYGLDQIGGRVDEFIKKGYLPDDIKSKMKVFNASNELDEKEYYQKAFNAIKGYEGLLPKDAQFKAGRDFYGKLDTIMDEYEIEGVPEMKASAKTAAFKDDESAYMAKAAFLRSEQENVSGYAKQKGYKLTPEEQKFFTMASYNGGFGNAQQMLDYYGSKKELGNNAFLKDRGNKGQIYDNIMPRYAGANLFTGEGYFKYGGEMPKKPKGVPKYQNGTEDPITPITLKNPSNVGINTWAAPSTDAPINPNAPSNEQIFRVPQQSGTPVDQGNIIPLGRFVNENYVNQQGQTTADVSAASKQSAENFSNTLDDVEKFGSIGITAINSYFNKQDTAKRQRTDRRQAIMQQQFAPTVNPYLEGTGSQAIMKNGGTIHIKPENRGKFTAAAKKAGMGVQAYAAKIMANPDNYSPTLRKRANFARNAAKWHEFGGEIEDSSGENVGIQTLDGGKSQMLSNSDHSNPMVEFIGKEHSKGGIGVQYGGSVAEVENKEIGWIDQEGGLNIFGKLKLPGTNQTFGKTAKDIADQEAKVDGQKSKYLNILSNGSTTDPYQESAQSTAKVMFKSLDKQSKQIAEKKEALASYQNLILSMTEEGNGKMKYGGKLPKKPYATGGEIQEDEFDFTGDPTPENIKKIAQAIGQFESSARYDAIGVPVTKGQYKGQRALGKYQIMEDNMRSWGKAATGRDITVAEFIRDPKLQDQVAEYQMSQIAKKNPNPADIASIWFTGRPTSNKSAGSAKDDLGTSGNQYVDAVMKIYGGLGGVTNTNSTASNFTGGPTSSNALNYTPNYTPLSGGNANSSIETKYGAARREPAPFSDKANIGNGSRERGFISPLAIEQIAPELLTIATNRRDPVNQLTYQPELKQTFDISYQLGRNENQSTFNAAAKIAENLGNVDALSEFAAQKYKADQQYNMQEVQGNAQQRLQTYSQNIDVLNDAKVKNLALIADQQTKQAQAKFNTRAEDLAAFRSISGKSLQNQLENRTYNAYANLFKHYGFDKKGNVTFEADKIAQRFSAGEAQQFGMMAAQQGAQAIMNGDFSRKFTKVKNQDGSQTTTETLGTNKKIQEEYKALKNQGFDDGIIGNMLRAKYPETISQD